MVESQMYISYKGDDKLRKLIIIVIYAICLLAILFFLAYLGMNLPRY